jgi:hypothetical protein
VRKSFLVVVTLLLAAIQPIAKASDVDPPKITSWKIINTVGDITSSSARFQAELTVEDESEFDDPFLQLLPTTSSQYSDFASLEVLSRTPKSKTYRATITIPVTAVTGVWRWSVRPLSDRNRNSTIGGPSPFASNVDFFGNNSVEVTNAAYKAKAEAEAKAKAEAEAKAKAEAEVKAKAEAEVKAKAEAEVKAKAKAKAEANSRTSTIVCVKGKSTLKVSGKKPKCPAGFKKK